MRIEWKGAALKVLGYSIPLGFLAVFCLYPLSFIASKAFTDGTGDFTIGPVLDLFSDPRSRAVLIFSVLQALISALLSILIALPGAWLLSGREFRGKSALMALTTVPFVLPPLVLAMGFLALWGSSGYVNSAISGIEDLTRASIPHIKLLYTKQGIVLAHVFLNVPVALRVLHSRMQGMDRRMLDASRSLGAGPVKTYFKVFLPQMRHSILAASSLVFTFCMLSFGAVLVVGGMGNPTIEVEIYRQYVGRLDDSRTGALLLVEMALVLLSTSVYLWGSRRASHRDKGAMDHNSSSRGIRRLSIGSKAAFTIYSMVLALLIIGPILGVVLDSFSGQGPGLTFEWYHRVFSREDDPTIGASPGGAVVNSILFGILVTAVSVPLSVAVAYLLDSRRFRGKGVLDTLLLFPLGVSSVGLGFGLLMAMAGGFPDMRGTWPIIVIVQTIIAYPFAARAVLSSKRELPENLLKAARSLGASRVRTFITVDLPLLKRGILVAAIFSFAISLGELGATLVVSAPEYYTMPVALYRFVSGGRDFGAATAYAVLMMAMTFLSLLVIEVVEKRLSGFEVDV